MLGEQVRSLSLSLSLSHVSVTLAGKTAHNTNAWLRKRRGGSAQNLVKVGPWKAAATLRPARKPVPRILSRLGVRGGQNAMAWSSRSFVRSPLTTRFYLLKGRRGRINARARQSVRKTVVGGEETVIVHATEHSSKATFVMIASACL